MDSFGLPRRKDQVVFVMGATGTGKSKLAIKLATHFGGEIVNSDKMQVYDGLDTITNKVTAEERASVPHHLIDGVPPDADFTASDFRREATLSVESILSQGRLPIIAGGSNSYIEELVEGANGEFKARFECCFLWVDVELTVLHEFVNKRVDVMVEQGLVEEAKGVFDPAADYSRGVRRSIGVPEMDRYLRRAAEGAEQEELARLLEAAIDETKANTCRLTCCQVEKIHRLRTVVGWDIKRIDATEVFVKKREGKGEEVWEKVVWGPGREIVERFQRADAASDTIADDKEVEIKEVTIANGNDVQIKEELVVADENDDEILQENNDVKILGEREEEESKTVISENIENIVEVEEVNVPMAAATTIQVVPTIIKGTIVVGGTN